MTSKAFAALAFTLLFTGCLFRDDDVGDDAYAPPTDPYDPTPVGGCDGDSQCPGPSYQTPCREYRCVARACQLADRPEGVEVEAENEMACRKTVCDGRGGTRTAPDPTALPRDRAPDCKRFVCSADGTPVLEPDPTHVPEGGAPVCLRATCDASGNVVTTPDASHVPEDEVGDCKSSECDQAGSPKLVPNPEDVPRDGAGDCMRDTCTAEGGFAKVVDDSDSPEPTTCKSYSCSNGISSATPINPTVNCSAAGYVCGADGECGTCPAPDAACTNPGYGSRDLATAHDFGGIGRTDSGGRWFCGAVPAGQADYTTYYENGTGFLAEFDPYFEIRPQVAARMCVFFDCPSIACPGGSTSETQAGQPGCCWNAAPGAFTGKQIDFCAGARVTTKVTTGATCAGYELHFHD